MRFTDTFIKMNSCVVGVTVGRPFCVIKFAIVYENFGVATRWSPVCVIGVRCCLSGTCVGATIGRLFV